MVFDDDDDDDGIGYGRDDKQRHVHADQEYAADLGDSYLRRRELGDQPVDDLGLFHPRVFRPQGAAVTRGRRVVGHVDGTSSSSSSSFAAGVPTIFGVINPDRCRRRRRQAGNKRDESSLAAF